MIDRGCFGLPSVYNRHSNVCSKCPVRVACANRAFEFLRKVSPVIDVHDLMVNYADIATPPLGLSGPQRTAVASMPGRVGPRLEKLFLSGFDQRAKQQIRLGQNPFGKTSNKVTRLLVDMLLRSQVDRSTLTDKVATSFLWHRTTASSEISNSIALLRGLDLIDVDGNLISIKP